MCRFSRSFIAEKNLVDHKKQGISHQITVSFISPNAEPHVHEPRKAGSSHQMISYRDPGPLGIKTVDIQEVGRFLTPSRSHTIVQERSDTFSHSCTFHRHTVLDFFPRWCTSMQQPTTHKTHHKSGPLCADPDPWLVQHVGQAKDQGRHREGQTRGGPPRCAVLRAVAWKYNIEERNPLGTSL